MDTVYLIHFYRRYKHVGHYTGSTCNLTQRLERHAKGQGARLIAVAQAAGISWTLARIWVGGKKRERQLKNQGGASRRCPICKGQTPGVPLETYLKELRLVGGNNHAAN